VFNSKIVLLFIYDETYDFAFKFIMKIS